MTTALIIAGLLLLLWLTTTSVFNPTSGKTSVIAYFNKNIKIIGVGIPEKITMRRAILPEDTEILKVLLVDPTPATTSTPSNDEIKIRVDDKTSSWKLFLFPKKVVHFDYKYKKFKPLGEVKATKGKLRWEPKIKNDDNGKPVKSKNDDETMVLGEWVEKMKSLFVRERDEVGLPFITGDGIIGIQKAYIKYIIWDMSLAISSVHNFKDDPEKAVKGLFASFAKDKEFVADVQGFSLENYQNKYQKADKFLQDLNCNIWMNGILVEDIEFEEPYLNPESEDILQEQEKIGREKIKQKVAEEAKKTKEAEALGDAAAKAIAAKAEADRITTEGVAANKVAVDKDKDLKGNETAQFKEQAQVILENNGKLIDKLEHYKGVTDETEVKKARELGKVKGTLIIKEGGKENSDLDDRILESIISAGNALSNNKNKGGTSGTTT